MERVLNDIYHMQVEAVEKKVVLNAPYQKNCYDCGLFMCEAILRIVRTCNPESEASPSETFTSNVMRRKFYCRLLTRDLKCLDSLAL